MNKIELTEGKNLNNQKTGIFYLLISAVLFSFVGIFVKGVEASSWDVIYWRALFGVIFVVIWYGFRLQLGKQLRLRMSGISIALLAVICTTAFLSSFKFTSIANVAMIYAVTPLMSGFLGWVILREHISKQDLIASIFAIIGVAVVVNGSVGQINIYGDGLAIVMAVTLALIIVLFRKYPDTPSGGVNILSCGILVFNVFIYRHSVFGPASRDRDPGIFWITLCYRIHHVTGRSQNSIAHSYGSFEHFRNAPRTNLGMADSFRNPGALDNYWWIYRANSGSGCDLSILDSTSK